MCGAKSDVRFVPIAGYLFAFVRTTFAFSPKADVGWRQAIVYLCQSDRSDVDAKRQLRRPRKFEAVFSFSNGKKKVLLRGLKLHDTAARAQLIQGLAVAVDAGLPIGRRCHSDKLVATYLDLGVNCLTFDVDQGRDRALL
jgi:hypothetical protein